MTETNATTGVSLSHQLFCRYNANTHLSVDVLQRPWAPIMTWEQYDDSEGYQGVDESIAGNGAKILWKGRAEKGFDYTKALLADEQTIRQLRDDLNEVLDE